MADFCGVMTLYEDFISTVEAHPLGGELLDLKVLKPKSDSEDSPESIRSRYNSGYYKDALHLLYVDLKLVVAEALAGEQISSPRYNEIGRFFEFAADLVLREGARLSQLTATGPEDVGDHYLASIAFEKLYADMDELYGESLFVLTNAGPMFTSMTGRCSIDPRDTEVHGTVHATKLLPHIASTPETTMGFTSPMNARIPHPAAQPTEMLSTFMSPTRTPLSHSRWIEPNAYGSFAPSRDDNGAIVPVEDTIAFWEEKAGMRGVYDQPAEVSSEPLKVDSSEPPIRSDTDTGLAPGEIDVAALLQWAPNHFVDDDEIEAARNGSERELAARLLLELQYLQRERLAAPSVELTVSDDEWRIALKVQNVIIRLLSDASSSDVGVKTSRKVPILLHNFAGTMPTVDPKPVQTQRISSMSSISRLPQQNRMKRK